MAGHTGNSCQRLFTCCVVGWAPLFSGQSTLRSSASIGGRGPVPTSRYALGVWCGPWVCRRERRRALRRRCRLCGAWGSVLRPQRGPSFASRGVIVACLLVGARRVCSISSPPRGASAAPAVASVDLLRVVSLAWLAGGSSSAHVLCGAADAVGLVGAWASGRWRAYRGT